MNGETKMPRQRFLSLSLLATGLLLPGLAPAQTYSKTESITYHDNTSKWILGQTASVTCTAAIPSNLACNGDDVASATTFDPTYAVPLTISAFGKLQQTLTYDTTSSVPSGQRGTLKTVSDGRDSGTYNTTITFSGWNRGIPELMSYPDGTSQSAEVNAHGWIERVTDEAGYTTSYTYDPMGRLASINYPDEAAPAPAYNSTTLTFAPSTSAAYGLPVGHWKQTVTTDRGRTDIHYDALWRPVVESTYDLDNVAGTISQTVTRYDAGGRVSFTSYPQRSQNTTVTNTWGNPAVAPNALGIDTEYDALGRVTRTLADSELGVLETTTDYQPGFKTLVIDPKLNQTTTSYLAWDQPATDFPVLIDLPEGTRTTIVRDPFGKPASIRRHNDANTVGITRSYTYNGYQELCSTVEPETGATLMGYDAAGNLDWSASGLPASTPCDPEGDTVTILPRRAVRSYDPRNRASSLSFPDGQGDTTYDYTADGLLDSITALNDGVAVTHNYTYNRRRLLTNEQLVYGNVTWNVGHAYNANGHLDTDTYPGGLNVAYAPNALGQPTKAGTYATGVSYHPNGGIKQFTYGNGIVHTMTQNARQLPDTSADAYGTKKFLSDGYDYDPNANVVAISDGATNHVGRMDRDMTYNGLDWLKTVTSPMLGAGASYTYDVLQNLTHVSVDEGGPSPHSRDHYYCYDENWQLGNVKTDGCSTGATVIGMDYDEQGNLKNKNGTVYTFDFGNRLRKVNPAGTIEPDIFYTYDGHGRRARDIQGANGYRISFYTQGGQLAFTMNGRSVKYTNYVYLGGSLVATREWPISTSTYTTHYQHTDALGTPIVMTDSNRNEVESEPREYEPYGQVINQPVKDGPGYTGHVMDAATGLAYMQQRYYDPMIGRFLSVDPVTADTVGGNFNRYWYAANSPYTFVDPDGRAPVGPDTEDPMDDPNRPNGCGTTRACTRGSEGDWHHGVEDAAAALASAAADFAASHPLPQNVVDGGNGLGAGIINGASFGFADGDYFFDSAESDTYDAFKTGGSVVGGAATGGALAKASGALLVRVAGPAKQWVRFGPSYSRALGEKIKLSLRWGASPAGNGKYLNQIPFRSMRQFNQLLRSMKLPGSNWRVADPGHLHLVKKP